MAKATKKVAKPKRAKSTGPVFDSALEEQIAEHPENDALRRVYADWLIEHGNPRGELAALQLAGNDASAFIAEHAELFHGPKVGKYKTRFDDNMSRLVWKGGFWDEVDLATAGSVEVATALLAHPSTRLLRALFIGEYQDKLEPFIEALAKLPRPALRKLVVGAYSEGQEIGAEGGRSCTNLALLAKAAPRLEQLRVRAAEVAIGSHPTLRAFSYECVTPPSRPTLKSLFAAKLPALEHLYVLIDGWGDEVPTVADFAPLFSGKLFPALRKVTLWCQAGPLRKGLKAAAAASPLAKRATITLTDFGGFEAELDE